MADVCAAVQWAGLARARETAAQLKNLGLHLPELLGDAGADTAACATCHTAARFLFHVNTATRPGRHIVQAAAKRAAEAAARRLAPEQQAAARAHVTRAGETDGAHVCVACAAPCMAAARGAGLGAPAATYSG